MLYECHRLKVSSRPHIAIPGWDPESRKHTFTNNLVAYTGFRVPARNDKMRPTA